MGISRTPVREALQALASENLVAPQGRRGFQVAPLQVEMIEELYEVRRVLEGLAAGLAARRATPDDIATLQQPLSAAPALLEGNDRHGLINMDREFHRALYRIAGNRILIQTMDRHWPHITRLMCVHLSMPGFPLQSFGEHRALVAAIERNDEETAVRLASDHVENAKRDLTRLVRR